MKMLAFHMQPNRLDQICSIDLDARATRALATRTRVPQYCTRYTWNVFNAHTHKYKQSLQIALKDSIKHQKKRPEQWHAHLHLTRRHEMWRNFGEVWCAKKSQDWLWQQLLHFRMVKECCMIFCSSNCVRWRFLLCSHFHAQLLSTSVSLLQLQPLSPMFATLMTSLHGGLYIISIISNNLCLLCLCLNCSPVLWWSDQDCISWSDFREHFTITIYYLYLLLLVFQCNGTCFKKWILGQSWFKD